MSSRDVFLSTMRFDSGTRSLKAEFGYWTTTIRRFLREGLPQVQEVPAAVADNGTISGAEKVLPSGSEFVDRNVRAFFGLDSYASKFPSDFSPRLPEKLVEDTDEHRIIVDRFGITKKEMKHGTSTPLDLSFPIASRRDFDAYKEHYQDGMRGRLPADWDRIARELAGRDYPIRLGGFPYGFLGFPRHLIGTTGLFLMMYDDPQLIKDINDFFLGFAMEYWSKIIEAIRPDVVMIWEDMAYSTGSMISGEAFEEFLSPYYVRMIDFLRGMGVTNIHVDCDGYIEDLIPAWVGLGVTGLFPMERKAGNDLERIRARFPRLQLLGGVDKRILAEGATFADIDRELAIVERVLSAGGFIPHVDHHVPDDACWRNFEYYRRQLNLLIDRTIA